MRLGLVHRHVGTPDQRIHGGAISFREDTRSASTGLWRRSTETAFYLSNTAITADRAAIAICDHWKIENTSYYPRDITMGEDRSRIGINPGVFARLRSFVCNILKAN